MKRLSGDQKGAHAVDGQLNRAILPTPGNEPTAGLPRRRPACGHRATGRWFRAVSPAPGSGSAPAPPERAVFAEVQKRDRTPEPTASTAATPQASHCAARAAGRRRSFDKRRLTGERCLDGDPSLRRCRAAGSSRCDPGSGAAVLGLPPASRAAIGRSRSGRATPRPACARRSRLRTGDGRSASPTAPRRTTRYPRACPPVCRWPAPGLMYAAVPMIIPASVARIVSVGEFFGSPRS